MPMEPMFSIDFDEGRTAGALHAAPDALASEVLAALSLPDYRGMVLVHGGAGGMSAELYPPVRRFLVEGLAPLAQEHRLLVVDGGTEVGVMRLLGEARQAVQGTFPLVGVLPQRFADYPGCPSTAEHRVPLSPYHSHFVFVEGDHFGAESGLLIAMLQASGRPGAAMVINGGDIVLEEAKAHAERGNPLITVRGSGRIADRLADPTSSEYAQLPDHIHLWVADIGAPQLLRTLLRQLLQL